MISCTKKNGKYLLAIFQMEVVLLVFFIFFLWPVSLNWNIQFIRQKKSIKYCHLEGRKNSECLVFWLISSLYLTYCVSIIWWLECCCGFDSCFSHVPCPLCSQDCLTVPDIKTAFSDCAPKIGKRDCLVQPCTALTG